jgi:hypothetical protein
MNEHVPAVLPADPRPPEVLPPLVVEAPASQALPTHTTEEIRALDQAFVANKEQNDAVAGLIGLWLSAPWLADLIADHFRTPPDEEETCRRTGDGLDPHRHC